MTQLENYIKRIESEIKGAESEIHLLERRINLLKSKLKDPEKAFSTEEKKGTARFKKASGIEVPKKQNRIYKLNQELKKRESEMSSVPVSGAGEKKEDKKTSWGGIF